MPKHMYCYPVTEEEHEADKQSNISKVTDSNGGSPAPESEFLINILYCHFGRDLNLNKRHCLCVCLKPANGLFCHGRRDSQISLKPKIQ